MHSPMTHNIRNLLRFFGLAFALLALTLAYWQLFRAAELTARNDNPRLVVAEQQIRRGAIVTLEGALLAETVIDGAGVAQRYYPEPLAAPVVGYYSLRYGTGGLEAAYDPQLRGVKTETWLSRLMHQPPIGERLIVTLDLAAQQRAAHALAEAGVTGAVILLQPDTGAIYVMANHPTFDPNALETTWDTLVDDPAAPLLNRVTQGLFPVGDLARLVGLISLMEHAKPQPESPFTIPLDELFASLSASEILATVRQLGLVDPWLFELPTSAATIPADLPAKGAEMSVTPLQVAFIGAAIANRGMVVPPSLVVRTSSTAAPKVRLIQPETAAALQPHLSPFSTTVSPEITGNQPLSWHLHLTNSDPPLVLVVVVTQKEAYRNAAATIAAATLLGF